MECIVRTGGYGGVHCAGGLQRVLQMLRSGEVEEGFRDHGVRGEARCRSFVASQGVDGLERGDWT